MSVGHESLKRAYRASLVYTELRTGFDEVLRRHDCHPTSGAVAALAFRDALADHLALNSPRPREASTRAGMAMIEAVKGTLAPAAVSLAATDHASGGDAA